MFSGGASVRVSIASVVLLSASVLGWAKPPAVAGPGGAPGKRGLISPWDMRQVAPTQAPYKCAATTEIAPTISILDKKYQTNPNISGEVQDAAYGESAQAVGQLAKRVVQAADA